MAFAGPPRSACANPVKSFCAAPIKPQIAPKKALRAPKNAPAGPPKEPLQGPPKAATGPLKGPLRVPLQSLQRKAFGGPLHRKCSAGPRGPPQAPAAAEGPQRGQLWGAGPLSLSAGGGPGPLQQ